VVLTGGQAFCSCPDAIYRKSVCKHAVTLALHAIRNPQEPKPQQDFHLGDRVQRNAKVGMVVCVSGDTVSVHWDTGRITPHTREELQAA
jgi:SWIM zinc finger